MCEAPADMQERFTLFTQVPAGAVAAVTLLACCVPCAWQAEAGLTSQVPQRLALVLVQGLSSTPQMCKLYVGPGNAGDGTTVCGEVPDSMA